MNDLKRKLLDETFTNKFSIGSFKKFTTEFFNDPEIMPDTRRTAIWKEFKNHISAYYTLAKYTDCNNDRIIVLAVELNKVTSIDRARSLQRNFVSKVLEENNFDAAIVAFYNMSSSSWRLSFMKIDYSFTEKGLELGYLPAKRYSYLLGENEPNNTAQNQLLPIFKDDLYNPSITEIEQAFSVEKVTKDFFKLYKDKYLQLNEYLKDDGAFKNECIRLGFEIDSFSEQFSKKLMGQLAFLYFLQKKGWLGVRIMPESGEFKHEDFIVLYSNLDESHKNILNHTFKKTENNTVKLLKNNLLSLTQHETNLFSECFINTQYDMQWGKGNKKFIREIFDYCVKKPDRNFFDEFLEPFFYDALNKKRENQYFKKFNCKIPFLNGGLFEPIEGYHWRDTNFEIPNTIFSNSNAKSASDEGILDIFDRFNFTINEEEPLEKEVAIDPEMLGKIFENLLEVSDRKSKGAFYTPREIVHYMCQESLSNYLVEEVDVPYDDIKEFILYGELIKDADNKREAGKQSNYFIKPSIHNKIKKIDDALKSVRVADPAVGSGAFPLGMLNEIIKVRNNITEYLIKMKRDGAFPSYSEDDIRKGRSPYKMKLYTIEHCIFAVDIEPSAIDIAKLRLWLSIVVDQELEENEEPHALPNLDMNIHVGNSLIDEYEGINLFDKSILHEAKKDSLMGIQTSMLFDLNEMFSQMFRLQENYFTEDNEQRKKELKQEFQGLQDKLINEALRQSGNTIALEKYNKVKNEKSKPFFIWELEFAKIFKENNGFDIVIGNPPYLGFHHVPDKEYFSRKYYSAHGKYDLYVLFIEKGINILKNKGNISYICPSYFYKRNYGKSLREFILSKMKINLIADFKDSQIFDTATTYTCIFNFEKNNENKTHEVKVVGADLVEEKAYFIPQYNLKEPTWLLENSTEMKIFNSLKNISQYTLGDITTAISQGIVTGNNSVFIIDKEFIDSNNINYNFLEPVYKGKNLRGNLNFANEYVFYPYISTFDGKNQLIEENIIEENNPNLYQYLLSKKDELLNRGYFIKSNKSWYELWNPRKKIHFVNRKFVFSEVNDYNDFILCDKCYYSDSACGFELKNNYFKYEEYISKYLNSDIITKLYRKISVPKANGYLIYKNAFLKNIPIYFPNMSTEQMNKLMAFSKDDFNNWLVAILEGDKY